MAGPAPTEMQYVDRQESELRKKMAPPVGQITGQPTTPASLKPEDDAALGKIKEGIVNFARYHLSKAGEAVIDKEPDADVVIIGGNEAINIAREKKLRERLLNRLGLKKAA